MSETSPIHWVWGGKAIIYFLGFLKGLVPGLGAFLCVECMFFLCLCRFSLGITASSQSPKTCMWGKLEIGKSKLSDVCAGVWLLMVVCLSMWWTMNWQSVTLPSSNSSWERLQQTLATPSAGKKGIEDEWLHGWISLSSVTKLRAPNYNLFFSFYFFFNDTRSSGLFVLEDHHWQNSTKIPHTKQTEQLENLPFFVWQARLHCQRRAQWPFSV